MKAAYKHTIVTSAMALVANLIGQNYPDIVAPAVALVGATLSLLLHVTVANGSGN